MKTLLIFLLPILCLKESLGTTTTLPPKRVRSLICYDCLETDSYKCEEQKICNSTAGFCHLLTYEGKDGELNIKKSCETDCGFPMTLVRNSKKYLALCCTFDMCNNLQYALEVLENHTSLPVSGFITSVLWAHFRIILQYVGLED